MSKQEKLGFSLYCVKGLLTSVCIVVLFGVTFATLLIGG